MELLYFGFELSKQFTEKMEGVQLYIEGDEVCEAFICDFPANPSIKLLKLPRHGGSHAPTQRTALHFSRDEGRIL